MLAIVLCLGGTSAGAQEQNFSEWLQVLESDAIAQGITPQTVHAALDNALLDDRVITLDRKQPETTITFDDYLKRNVNAQRVKQARQLYEDNQDILKAIAGKYGVPAGVIVALWGMESSFGQASGHFSVIDSLMTLAFEGRRAEFFRMELIEALKILDEQHLPAAALRGSWAGAMGQCQFMPSTYRKYAIDYHGNGVRNIWGDRADVWSSIANYLAAEGWKAGQGWGFEVDVPDSQSLPVGADHPQAWSFWRHAGVDPTHTGVSLPDNAELFLIQPDGPGGKSFLATNNYRALLRWNRSTYFATTVGLFSDRIK